VSLTAAERQRRAELEYVVERTAEVIFDRLRREASRDAEDVALAGGRSTARRRQDVFGPLLHVDAAPDGAGSQASERLRKVSPLHVPGNGPLRQSEKLDDLGEADQLLALHGFEPTKPSRHEIGDVVAKARSKRSTIPRVATTLPTSSDGSAERPTSVGPPPRRVRVAEGVYQRIDRKTRKPVPGKFEFTYRDVKRRQVWQTAKGKTKAAARAERAQMLARLRLGQRVERTDLTVAAAAAQWLERGIGQKGQWEPATRERYERIVRRCVENSADPTLRPIGQLKLRDAHADQVAAWTQANARELAPTTASLALIALNQIFRFALRRGWIADNPVTHLEPGEKPRWTPQRVSILEPADLGKLLDHAGPYRLLFEFLAYSGLRIGEALGLCWADVDFDAGLIRVHRQLSRRRVHKKLKTPAGRREVVLAPHLATLLREHWLASAYKGADDFVFANTIGRGRDYRDVGEGFRSAIKKAGLAGDGKRLILHSLRHTFASLLIAQGLNIVFVSRQLGHANATITLEVYAHLFEQADHATAARNALDATHARRLATAAT
jgi:integrase